MSDKIRNFSAALLIALALAGAGGYFFFSARLERARQEQDARHRKEIAELQDAVKKAHGQIGALEEQLKPSGAEVERRQTPVTSPPPQSSLEAVRLVGLLQKQVADLTESNKSLQSRAVGMQGAVDRLTAENQRISSETEDLRESLEKTRRVVAAMETELKTKTERILQLETSLQRTREENAGNAGQVRLIANLLKEYEELNRRRENSLGVLQRRYRELTDLYRSTLLTIEQQRDNPAIRQLPDASRIQGTVQSAEDDLRQLNAMNVQAQRIAQRLQGLR